MTEFHCLCCDGRKGTVIYKGLTSVYSSNHWSIASCDTCRNYVTMPVPGEQLLYDIYSNTYLYPVHHLILGEKMMRAKDLAVYIKKLVPGTGKKIFEVGCMYGYLLGELKQDFEVKGIELGEEAVDTCRRHGLDVLEMSLESYLLNFTESFDVIILSHVFEHLLCCDEILAQLRDRLNAGGCIIILVPDSQSITRKIFGSNWGWWQVPVHINHFSELPLTVLAKRTGLHVTHVRHKGGDSLMLLLNFINIFRFHKQSEAPGRFQKMIIKFFTSIFRFWYFIGNEEITIVMKRD